MRRLGLLTAFALVSWHATAFAQTTSTMIGKITDASTNKPVEGAVVVVKSPALQGEQVATSDGDGRYIITLLPPGVYEIHVEATGFKSFDQGNVTVPLAKTIKVNVALAPVAVAAKEIVVTAKQTATVDQGSTTTGILFEKELLEKIPLGRTYESALLLVPGSVSSNIATVGVGFAGATGVENNFLIDGMNTTNPGFGGLGTQLPPEFMEQMEVKIGGYMPEFGRANGAVINAVLKSGGNEFHGDIFYNYTGSWLQAIGKETFKGAIGRRDTIALRHDFGVALGGPIVKDKLWFFVGFDPDWTLRDVNRFTYRLFQDATNTSHSVPGYRLQAGCSQAEIDGGLCDPVRQRLARQMFERNTRVLRFAAKLTWAPTPTQRLSLSYFGDPSQISGIRSRGTSVEVINAEPSNFLGTIDFGSQNVIMNYSGKFLDKRVQVEATAGYYREINRSTGSTLDTPWRRFTATGIQMPELGSLCRQDPSMSVATCPVLPEYQFGGTFNQNQIFQRGSLATKVSFFLPRNQIKIGADLEWNTYTDQFYYSGGQREFWQSSGTGARARDLNGDGIRDTELIRRVEERGFVLRGPMSTILRQQEVVKQRAFSRNFGMFLQDSVNLMDNLTLNAGLRYEVQQLYGTAGPRSEETDFFTGEGTGRILNTVLTLNKNVAPRAGLIWDPFRDGRTKVFGQFGVYYESVPLDLGHRALGPLDVFAQSNRDLRDNLFGTAGPFGTRQRFLGGTATGIQTDISPQYHYEWSAGVEHEIMPSYRIGLTWMKRIMGNVIEDISADDSNYFIGNPGKGPTGAQEIARLQRLGGDAQSQLDSRCGFRSFDENTGAPIVASIKCTGDFPTPVRDYDAWTLYFEKRLTEDQPWQFKFSYTLSWLRGNYPGLFAPDNGQLDPNLSSQFDLISLQENRFGDLPFDRRHNIKLFGSYTVPKKYTGNHGITLGLGLSMESGAPVNTLGAHEIYQASEGFIFPRGETPPGFANRTPWTFSPDIYFEYSYQINKDMRLSFNAVVFNFLNLQETIAVDQDYTFDVVCPLKKGQKIEDLRTFDSYDPISGACVPGTGTVTVNPNFGKSILNQFPISARFGLKLTF
jgi:hypothetical protein